MNLGPSGYEPDELPGCSTPRRGVCGLGVGCVGWVCGVGVGCLGWWGVGGLADLAAADCPATSIAVSWALEGFTAEFGMGSGGARSAKATRSAKPCGAGARPCWGCVLGGRRGWGRACGVRACGGEAGWPAGAQGLRRGRVWARRVWALGGRRVPAHGMRAPDPGFGRAFGRLGPLS